MAKLPRVLDLRRQSTRHRIVLLCAIVVSLFSGTAGKAQSGDTEYNCMHLFSTASGSDYHYDIGLNAVLPQERLPGPAGEYLKSADGKWFAFGTAPDSNYAKDIRIENTSLLYIGPTIQGQVRFTRDNPIGFVQGRIFPWSLSWSPQKARLAYLYTRTVGDKKRPYTLAVFDVETRRKQEVDFLYDKIPLVPQWSPDGQYLVLLPVKDTSVREEIPVFSSDPLESLSAVTMPEYGWFGAPAARWQPLGNQLAVLWWSTEGKPAQLALLKPGQPARNVVIDTTRADAILWSPDGAYLAILAGASEGTYSVSLLDMAEVQAAIDAAASTPVKVDKVGDAAGIRWTTNSQALILFDTGGHDLVTYRPRTHLSTIIAERVEGIPTDGNKILRFFPGKQSSGILIDPLEVNPPERVPAVLATYKNKTGSQYSLDLLNLNTLEQRHLLTTARPEDLTIRWSPDYTAFLVFQIETADVNAPPQRLYWGTANGKTFRQLDNAALRKNILARRGESEAQITWLDDASRIAFVAAPSQQGDDKTQTVLLVNLATGATRVISEGFQAAAFTLNRQEPGWLQFSWLDRQSEQGPSAFVQSYSLDGTRVFRYPLNPASLDAALPTAPVHAFRSPGGDKVAILVGASDTDLPLFLSQGQDLKRVTPGPNPADPHRATYTGVVWSPDGRRFAAYEAGTLDGATDALGRRLLPSLDPIDIYTAEGAFVATVPYWDVHQDGAWIISFLWERCTDAFPAPYGPEDMAFENVHPG